MGDYDYVKAVLDRIGAMDWMQIAIKPAKPFAFGLVEGTPVFGLPRQPGVVHGELRAAGQAGPAVHGRPLRSRPRSGAGRGRRPPWPGAPTAKPNYMRVSARRDDRGRWRVAPSGGQGSHQLAAMARADALAVVPDGAGIAPGDPVEIILL